MCKSLTFVTPLMTQKVSTFFRLRQALAKALPRPLEAPVIMASPVIVIDKLVLFLRQCQFYEFRWQRKDY